MFDENELELATRAEKPSREAVEQLCLLYAARAGGTYAEVLRSLGVSAEHASLVEEMYGALTRGGRVSVAEGRVTVTRDGTAWMAEQLARWGVEG